MCVLVNAPCIMKAMADSIVLFEHLRSESFRDHTPIQVVRLRDAAFRSFTDSNEKCGWLSKTCL